MYTRYAVAIEKVDEEKLFKTKQAALEEAQKVTIYQKLSTTVYRQNHFSNGMCNIYEVIHYWWDERLQYTE